MTAENLVRCQGYGANERGVASECGMEDGKRIEFGCQGNSGEFVIQQILDNGVGSIRIIPHDDGGEVEQVQGVAEGIGDVGAESLQHGNCKGVLLIAAGYNIQPAWCLGDG